MRNYKFIWSFFILALALVVLVGGFVFLVDPLHQYRSKTTGFFIWQERYQNPGLAKTQSYDTIILGSSMTENFYPSEVGRLLNGKVLKLSIEGSTAREQRMLADIAVGTGQVKKVLWGFDYFSIREDSVRDEETFPFYLYDNNRWNDYKYLLNKDNVQHAAASVLIPSSKIAENRKSLELLNNWDARSKYGAEYVLDKWKEARIYQQLVNETEPTMEVAQQRFDEHIFSLVQAHPEIEFIFYFPPYSVIRQQVWYSYNPARFEQQLELQNYAVQQLSTVSNARVHNFQAYSDITYNLEQYKDLSHHSAAINSLIVEKIAAGEQQVTTDNIEQENEWLRQQVAGLVIDEQRQMVYTVDTYLNGEQLELDPSAMDGELFVPIKLLAQATGASLNYDTKLKQMKLSYGDQTIVMNVDEASAMVNDQLVQLDSSLQIKQNRLVGPLVPLLEFLGGTIEIETDSDDSYMYHYMLSL